MPGTLIYSIRAKDEFSGTFNKLMNASEMASAFIVANLGIAAGRAITDMTSTAVEEFADVDISLRRITSAIGEFGESADEMANKIKEDIKVGAQLGFTMEQTAQTLEGLVMAGFEMGEAMSALTPTLRLATIESMSLTEAVQLTVSILGMYGLEASEAARVSDVLASAAREGVLPISKIGMGLAYVGKQAASMGSSLEETTAALVLATNQGLRAHMAGRYLRRMLEDLVKKEDELGFSIRDTAGEMYNLTVLVEKLNDHLNSLSTSHERQNYISRVFGVQSQTLVTALTNMRGGMVDNVDQLKKLTEEFKEVGSAAEMSEGILSGFGGELLRFRALISQVRLELGENLAPLFSSLYPLILQFSTAFVTILRPAISTLTSVVRSFTPVLMGMGEVLIGIGPIFTSLASRLMLLKISFNIAATAIRKYHETKLLLWLVSDNLIKTYQRLSVAMSLWNVTSLNTSKSMVTVIRMMEKASPALAAIRAGILGLTKVKFSSARAWKIYRTALYANTLAMKFLTPIINAVTAALARLNITLASTAGAMALLSTVVGLGAVVLGIYTLQYAFSKLGEVWKNITENMKTIFTRYATEVIDDINALQDALGGMEDDMSSLGRGINAMGHAVSMNEQKIKQIERALDEGRMSYAAASLAIDTLRAANVRLTPILEEARLKEAMLRDQLDALTASLKENEAEMENAKDAYEILQEMTNALVLDKKDLNEVLKDGIKRLKELGVEASYVEKGFLRWKNVILDVEETLKRIDEVTEKYTADNLELKIAVDMIKEKIMELEGSLGMTEVEWRSFWDSIAETSSARGRGMLGVLLQLTGAMKGLQYVSGATGREITRLDLRYRENELMIREIEKAMREGTMSYAEGSAAIMQLRKENEELALARDEARLEQDKINLAMEEASETIKAYETALEKLIHDKEAIIAEMRTLEELQADGIVLTQEQKDRYEELKDELAGVNVKIDDYTQRLDAIKERFPAIETALLNLREAIREFAANLDSNAQAPLDEILLTIGDINTADFSTEFDFIYDPVMWEPIMDDIEAITDEDYVITITLELDLAGIFELLDDVEKDMQKEIATWQFGFAGQLPEEIDFDQWAAQMGDTLPEVDEEEEEPTTTYDLTAMEPSVLAQITDVIGNTWDSIVEAGQDYISNLGTYDQPYYGIGDVLGEDPYQGGINEQLDLGEEEPRDININVTVEADTEVDYEEAARIAETIAREMEYWQMQ